MSEPIPITKVNVFTDQPFGPGRVRARLALGPADPRSAGCAPIVGICMQLRVSEVFASVQGKGVTVGTPSALVRLQGCSVGIASYASSVVSRPPVRLVCHQILDHRSMSEEARCQVRGGAWGTELLRAGLGWRRLLLAANKTGDKPPTKPGANDRIPPARAAFTS